jgi:hypothetical protein
MEFSYLNWNLMVPKLRLLTLAFDGRSRKDGHSRKADNVSSLCAVMMPL